MPGIFEMRIAALTAVILFLFAVNASQAQIDLATDLFKEAEWKACVRECERVLSASPSNSTACLLKSVASLRLGRHIDRSIASLEKLSHSKAPTEIRAKAAYECGRAEWRRRHYEAAVELFQAAFFNTLETDLFLRSACSLFLLMEEKPELRKGRSGLVTQVNTSRTLWRGKLFGECRIKERGEKTRLLGYPGKWIVAFYRSQIGPAIGQRCPLTPSCSEYFLQACKKYGLLGFSILADRCFREPGVRTEGRKPVVMGDVVKYADPLSDHDFWMKRNARRDKRDK